MPYGISIRYIMCIYMVIYS